MIIIANILLLIKDWKLEDGRKILELNMVQKFGCLLRICDRQVMVENKSISVLDVLNCALSL